METQNLLLAQPTESNDVGINFRTKKIKTTAGEKKAQKKREWTIRKRKALAILLPLVIAGGVIAFFSYKTNAEIGLLATQWNTPLKVDIVEQKVLAGENLSPEEQVWYILDKEYKFTLKEKIKALGIIQCESNFDPYAINKNSKGTNNYDLGIWQINEPSHKGKGLTRACAFDIACATKFAIEQIYLKQGNWGAWVCSR